MAAILCCFFTLRSNDQTEYSDSTGHNEIIVDINKELNDALELVEETDLDPSSSLMSLFIPQNTTEDSNATKNNGTKKHTLADEPNSEDLEEINEPKIIVTKIHYKLHTISQHAHPQNGSSRYC